MDDLDYARSLPVGVRHIRDDCAVPALDPAALRVKRFILLCGCQQIAFPHWREVVDQDSGEIAKKSEFRVSICCRQPVDDSVRVYRFGDSVGYSGLMRCGNVWACPICCAKVMRVRGEQLAALFKAVHDRGGSAFMVTFTAAHELGQPLAELLDSVKSAKRRLTQDRRFRELTEARSGAVTTTEITYGGRGWHPHQHDAWFYDFVPQLDEDQLAEQLFPLWRDACAKFGLTTQERYRNRRIGVDVRRAWDASEYLAKFDRERDWSLSSEMTAGRLKTAQGQSMTPWGLLEEAIGLGPSSHAALLWLEYMRATKGKSVVSLKAASKLLKEFGLPSSVDDWKDANRVGEGEVVGTITAEHFDRVVRKGGLGKLLEQFRSSAGVR